MNPKKKGIIQIIRTHTTTFKSFFLAFLNTHTANIANKAKGIIIKQMSMMPIKSIGLKFLPFLFLG